MTSLTLSRNALFNLVSFGTSTVVNILLVPVMLTYLGPVGFGVWAIIRAFVGYASVADLGLTSTATKYVAEFAAKDDTFRIGSILKTAMALYALVFLGILALVWLGRAALIGLFFESSGPYASEIDAVLFGSLMVFAMSMIFSVFQSALTGIQRMDLTNIALTVTALVNGTLMFLALTNGFGLTGLVAANAIATLTSGMLHWIFFRRAFGKGLLQSGSVTLSDARMLIGYSKHIFIGALANSIHLHYDKLLLSSYLTLAAVSTYEIGSRVVQQIRQIPILMLQPLLPAASDIQARRGTGNIPRLYLRILKYLISGIVPLAGILALTASSFITVWVGPGHELAVTTLRILLISNAINLLTAPGYFIAIGMGNARLAMYSSVLGLGLNIVLSFLFLHMYGYLGAVTGSFSALIIASLFFLALFHRSMDISWLSVLRLMVAPLVALCAAAGAWWILTLVLHSPLLLLLVSGALATLTYAAVLFVLPYFDSQDRVYAIRIRDALFSAPGNAPKEHEGD